MTLGWTFPLNFSTLADRVQNLNDSLDRRLVNMTMNRLGVERAEAERIVSERVDAATAKTMTVLGV